MKKFLKNYGVWIPVFGAPTTYSNTEYGRYRTIYFAGWGWIPYQAICSILLLGLCSGF